MAGNITNAAAALLLDHYIGGVTDAPQANWYLALYTVTPTNVAAGTEVSTSGTAYARKVLANNKTNFASAVAATRNVSNAVLIQMAQATSDWGTVVGAALLDSGGAIKFWCDVTNPKLIQTGDRIEFAAGSLVFTML